MADPKWLKELGDAVAAATKEIARLRRQNKSLSTQLQKAKGELTASKQRAASEPAPEAEAWAGEREEIRRRVARLVDTLEELQ